MEPWDQMPLLELYKDTSGQDGATEDMNMVHSAHWLFLNLCASGRDQKCLLTCGFIKLEVIPIQEIHVNYLLKCISYLKKMQLYKTNNFFSKKICPYKKNNLLSNSISLE